jgi:bifunctional non-homologous end joining protein LigD
MRDEPPCSGVASASASWRVRDTKVAEAIASGIQLSEAFTGDGAATFRHACRMNLEGIASKPIGSRYVSGRTRAWLKRRTGISSGGKLGA